MPYLPEGLPQPNYDEAKVPTFTMPCPLTKADKTQITSAEDWEKFQRGYILRLLEEHMYGTIPPAPAEMHIDVISEKEVYGGIGTRKHIRLVFKDKYAENIPFDILAYAPKAKNAPCVTGLNFGGNHSIECDEDIPMPDYEIPDDEPKARGSQNHRWVPKYLLERGFGLVTGCYNQLFCDKTDGTAGSIYRLFYSADTLKKAAPGEYTSISAWSWGLMRICDYIASCGDYDTTKIIATGHSRLGKTALWAGANDQRFSVIVSNNSGCGGAALTKREFGETLEIMNGIFPHWLTPQAKLDGKVPQQIAYDQNFLLSLAAPRALAVASASEDAWADPKGEYLGLVGTNSVYALYGIPQIPSEPVPQGNESFDDKVRHYHCRIGKHDILIYDWEKYLDFAERCWEHA